MQSKKDYLKEKKETEIAMEMVDFCEDQEGFSYYDLKAYAYNNDKQEWIDLLKSKKYRQFIAIYLRSKRKSDGIKYKNDFVTATNNAFEAEEKYYKRHRNVV